MTTKRWLAVAMTVTLVTAGCAKQTTPPPPAAFKVCGVASPSPAPKPKATADPSPRAVLPGEIEGVAPAALPVFTTTAESANYGLSLLLHFQQLALKSKLALAPLTCVVLTPDPNGPVKCGGESKDSLYEEDGTISGNPAQDHGIVWCGDQRTLLIMPAQIVEFHEADFVDQTLWEFSEALANPTTPPNNPPFFHASCIYGVLLKQRVANGEVSDESAKANIGQRLLAGAISNEHAEAGYKNGVCATQ